MSAEFFARAGLSFARTSEGDVIVRWCGHQIRLSVEQWATVVASVSARGDVREARNDARAVHDLGPEAEAEPLPARQVEITSGHSCGE